METTEQTCPECGAVWHDEQTCQDALYQMLAWEFEYPAYGVVHHLMVLCYHLQHPHLYSPEGLNEAIHLLSDFLVHRIEPEQVRSQRREVLSSSNRTWKIKGTPSSFGIYRPPVSWTLTAMNVIANGADNYCESVRTWAQSVYESLKASGSLTSE